MRVVDSLFVLADAELHLADPPRGGFVLDFDARYRVTFAPVTDSLWLPAGFEREGHVEVGTSGSRLPRVSFRQTTWLSRFAPGRPGPPSLWQRQDRYYAPAGLYAGEEVYREARERWPLSEREEQAPEELVGRTFKGMFYRQGFLAKYITLPIEGSDDEPR